MTYFFFSDSFFPLLFLHFIYIYFFPLVLICFFFLSPFFTLFIIMLSNNALNKEGESDAILFARNELVQDVKVTIISHPYLDDMLDKLRTKDIPWEVH